jgi:hypothetical protein
MRRIFATLPSLGFSRTKSNFQKEKEDMEENRRVDEAGLFKVVAGATIGLIIVGLIVWFTGAGGKY